MDNMIIPSITVICYLVAEFFKIVILKKKSKYKYVPIIVGFTGGVLGLIMNILNPYTDILTSMMIGILSGLASTGANQVIKQIIKKEGNNDE